MHRGEARGRCQLQQRGEPGAQVRGADEVPEAVHVLEAVQVLRRLLPPLQLRRCRRPQVRLRAAQREQLQPPWQLPGVPQLPPEPLLLRGRERRRRQRQRQPAHGAPQEREVPADPQGQQPLQPQRQLPGVQEVYAIPLRLRSEGGLRGGRHRRRERPRGRRRRRARRRGDAAVRPRAQGREDVQPPGQLQVLRQVPPSALRVRRRDARGVAERAGRRGAGPARGPVAGRCAQEPPLRAHPELWDSVQPLG
mmetsp:Transcript_34920/g.109752  ORF Transcript_34920/g.109752 Transcript_34920/m.109752 type:complete len:251 (-) Transcript_34920:874-1626(-)